MPEALFELTRLSIGPVVVLPVVVVFGPVLLFRVVEDPAVEPPEVPADVPADVPDDPPADEPPAPCANATLEPSASIEASATVVSFMSFSLGVVTPRTTTLIIRSFRAPCNQVSKTPGAR